MTSWRVGRVIKKSPLSLDQVFLEDKFFPSNFLTFTFDLFHMFLLITIVIPISGSKFLKSNLDQSYKIGFSSQAIKNSN